MMKGTIIVIAVEKVAFSYRSKQVLKDISLKILPDNNYALIGPNGAGKTTLIKLISSQLILQKGEISYFGNDLKYALSKDIKKRIGATIEIGGVYSKMTGYEYLSLVGSLFDLPEEEMKKKIFSMSKEYRLEEDLQNTICKYSAGMKKKIEFIAATMHSPDILLLDEPFESVDTEAISIMLGAMARIKSNGGSCLVCSHMYENLMKVCNRCIYLNHGQVVFDGIIEDNLQEICNILKEGKSDV